MKSSLGTRGALALTLLTPWGCADDPQNDEDTVASEQGTTTDGGSQDSQGTGAATEPGPDTGADTGTDTDTGTGTVTTTTSGSDSETGSDSGTGSDTGVATDGGNAQVCERCDAEQGCYVGGPGCIAVSFCVEVASDACHTCMEAACQSVIGSDGDLNAVDLAAAIGGCGDAEPYANAYDCMAAECLDACTPGAGFTDCDCA